MIALGCDIYMIVASALCFEDQTHDGKQKPHQTTLCIYWSQTLFGTAENSQGAVLYL